MFLFKTRLEIPGENSLILAHFLHNLVRRICSMLCLLLLVETAVPGVTESLCFVPSDLLFKVTVDC